MTEKLLVVNNLELDYKGIFDFQELYSHIAQVLEERGYRKHQKDFEELVHGSGKQMYIELRPVKTKTAYASLMLKIKMNLDHIREVQTEIDDIPRTMQTGDIHITFDAWTTTDLNQRWGNKPVFYFIRGVINKWIYRFPLEAGFPGEVADDVHHLYQQVKAHLNLYKYKMRDGEKTAEVDSEQ